MLLRQNFEQATPSQRALPVVGTLVKYIPISAERKELISSDLRSRPVLIELLDYRGREKRSDNYRLRLGNSHRR
jgi:hypothetical protein